MICDEHHHAAVTAAWGKSADSAFTDAAYVLVLTGTPIRSDGEETTWFAYDSKGRIDHPEDGTYTLTYGEAVDLGYCRPITFHRLEGYFSVRLDDSATIDVSGECGVDKTQKSLKVVKPVLRKKSIEKSREQVESSRNTNNDTKLSSHMRSTDTFNIPDPSFP